MNRKKVSDSAQGVGSGRAERIPIPKEHGAWALLYGPYMLSVLAFPWRPMLWVMLLVAITFLYLAHEPLLRIVRSRGKNVDTERRNHWRRWLLIFLLPGLSACFVIAAIGPLAQVIPFGFLVAACFLIHIVLAGRKEERTHLGELVGVVGLTTTVPVAGLLAGEGLGMALRIWILCILYFSSAIFFVKMLMTRFMGRPEAPRRTVESNVYHSLLLPGALWTAAPIGVLLGTLAAFLPAVIRAFWGLRLPSGGRLNLKRIGYTEVALTVWFVVIVGLSLQWR